MPSFYPSPFFRDSQQQPDQLQLILMHNLPKALANLNSYINNQIIKQSFKLFLLSQHLSIIQRVPFYISPAKCSKTFLFQEKYNLVQLISIKQIISFCLTIIIMQNQIRAYQIFYSKDIRKKKKVYSDGFLLCSPNKTKLFNAEGQCLIIVNNKHKPQLQEQYTLNNVYIVVIDKEIPYQSYISGKIFLDQQAPTLPPVKKIVKKIQSLHKIQIDVQKTFQNGLKLQSFIYGRLRPHQIQGVKFMYECITGQKGNLIQGCILADFMGLGKTLQTLTLIRCSIIQKIANKIVVVCPLTLLKVWQRQCNKWMGNKLSPLVSLGNAEQISKIIRMFVDYDYRFLIVSYQNFYKFSDLLSKKCQLLIFDEGHRLKNKKSKFFKKIQTFKCKKRILLTGTPLQNNLDELYTCIAIVNPLFFQSETVFKNVFQKPILAGMAKNSSIQQRALAVSRTAELACRIKEFSLRRKANVLQQYLPKKREYQIFLKLSPLQEVFYNRIKKKKMNESDVLSFINVMRKLFVHPILFKNDRFQNQQLKDCLQDCREEKSPKMEFIRQVALSCRQNNEKLIIVSYFTETLDFVQQMLSSEGISLVKLDGRVDGQQRYRIVQNFFKDKSILLLSGKAGGTGLTLTCACKMIMIEPDWNPSNDSQVMGRIWRQGQEKQVQIFRLIVACSFQQKILQRQQLKQSLSQKLIDQNKNDKSYDFFSLKQLFLQMAPKCITYNEKYNKVPECFDKFPSISWKEVVHVQIIQTHNSESQKIANQFEEPNFEALSEGSQTEDEQFNIDEAQNYESISFKPETTELNQQIEQLEEAETESITQKPEEIKQKVISAENLENNSANQNCEVQQKKQAKLPNEVKIELPLVLRKLKKNLKQLS